ncbi:MAG: 4Fe-4S dicluster domain-containing protein [Actinomycetaceae bacterium]|nr:4Fe-4S dicluster domain-containing protein [Arcanobacterium sp.]MDD7687044.1 4Fe-4S dicluster domain-containing protein [Actinomycetaceae bacterium]MDY5273299.1 4Fe-4S dicluster domain-containing protein [Arcanobacterium sp.]
MGASRKDLIAVRTDMRPGGDDAVLSRGNAAASGSMTGRMAATLPAAMGNLLMAAGSMSAGTVERLIRASRVGTSVRIVCSETIRHEHSSSAPAHAAPTAEGERPEDTQWDTAEQLQLTCLLSLSHEVLVAMLAHLDSAAHVSAANDSAAHHSTAHGPVEGDNTGHNDVEQKCGADTKVTAAESLVMAAVLLVPGQCERCPIALQRCIHTPANSSDDGAGDGASSPAPSTFTAPSTPASHIQLANYIQMDLRALCERANAMAQREGIQRSRALLFSPVESSPAAYFPVSLTPAVNPPSVNPPAAGTPRADHSAAEYLAANPPASKRSFLRRISRVDAHHDEHHGEYRSKHRGKHRSERHGVFRTAHDGARRRHAHSTKTEDSTIDFSRRDFFNLLALHTPEPISKALSAVTPERAALLAVLPDVRLPYPHIRTQLPQRASCPSAMASSAHTSTENASAENSPASAASLLCTGCHICADLCPTDALIWDDSSPAGTLTAYPQRCTSCCACIERCPESILEFSSEGASQPVLIAHVVPHTCSRCGAELLPHEDQLCNRCTSRADVIADMWSQVLPSHAPIPSHAPVSPVGE